MPYAASSRMAVIARLNKIVELGSDRPIHMPRSGPWKHRIPNQRKMLPVYTGRTEHRDVWNLPDESAPRRSTMDNDTWEEWHGRRASCEIRALSSGDTWTVPTSMTAGYSYISQVPDARSRPTTHSFSRNRSTLESSFASYGGGSPRPMKAAFVQRSQQ
eukprot:CAMPEP_0172015948 /NCGR_PEP_ID=MMETSP1041-20130122/10745_1 /TAXON_ID=464988 /ORGANISM="Hemiselmis andersenii, Strain CCMP439" /LENGTH=158 /DNA_ID=CAMNT_0012670829 /DNA_START=38 /DNA_END=514 /DNA_ORIENTATION=-